MRPTPFALVLASAACLFAGLSCLDEKAPTYEGLDELMGAGMDDLPRVMAFFDKEEPYIAKEHRALAMWRAAESGSPETIRVLVATGCPVDPGRTEARIAMEGSPLMLAVERNGPDAVKALLQAGAKPYATDEYGMDAMFKAVTRDPFDPGMMAALVEGGYEFSHCPRAGSALGYACSEGKWPAVRMALGLGADPEMPICNEGLSFFMAAVANRADRDTIEAFLAAGAEVGTVNVLGQDELMVAALWSDDLGSLHRLMEAGASPRTRDRWGNDALMMAAWDWIDRPPGVKGAFVRALLSGGADPRARNRWGETALMIACGWPEGLTAAKALVDSRAPLETRDGTGRTALFHAAIGGGEEMVKLLLKAGAEVDARDASGMTPLMAAVAEPCSDWKTREIEALLEAGADTGARSAEDKRAFDYLELNRYHGRPATAEGDPLYWRLFGRADGASWTTLHEYCIARTDADVKKAIDSGIDPDARDAAGRTALMWAAANGCLAAAEVLIAKGADLEAVDAYGTTALGYAAFFGGVEMVRLLLAEGAKVGGGSRKDGLTPFLLHCMRRLWAEDTQSLGALFDAGATGLDRDARGRTMLDFHEWGGAGIGRSLVNAVDAEGRTVIMRFAAKGVLDEAMIEGFLSLGADLSLRDASGKTALELFRPSLWYLQHPKEALQALESLSPAAASTLPLPGRAVRGGIEPSPAMP